MRRLKVAVYNLIRDDDENNLAGNVFDACIITLIIINVLMVILDTFKMPAWFRQLSYYVELSSVIVFTIEYLLRLWVSDLSRSKDGPVMARIKYIFSFMAVIDLLAILPFYLPLLISIDLRVLRILRMVRLIRLLKVNRYTKALKTIGDVFKNKASQLFSSMFVVLLLMIASSIIIYNVENPVQPDVFSNAFSGMWWSIVTLTTVGYGDIYPITVPGRVFSAVIALLGIGLIAVPTGILSSGFVERIAEKQNVNHRREEKKHYCPYCGKYID